MLDRITFDTQSLRSALINVFPENLWKGRPSALAAVIWLLPLAIWGALWLSLQSGDIDRLWQPASVWAFFKSGVTSAIPFLGVLWALTRISTELYVRRPALTLHASPLGLTIVYGAVGFIAVALSPDASIAIFWVVAYTSVPLVLLGLVLGDTGPARLSLLINFTWLIFIAAAVALFIFALINLDLANSILHPLDLYECRQIGHWLTETSGVLRSTGVGRYSAIAGLISLGFLWRAGDHSTPERTRYSRILWGVLLVGALMLLLSTGARTSIVAFVGGVMSVFLVYGGKKAIVATIVAIALLAPLAVTTSFHDGFVKGCIFNEPTRVPSKTEPIIEKPVVPLVTPTPTPPLATPTPASSLVAPTLAPPAAGGPGTGPEPTIPTEIPDMPSRTPAPSPPPPVQQEPVKEPEVAAKTHFEIAGIVNIPRNFFSFSGRTGIWKAGMVEVSDSLILGHGFHADRLLIQNHMHNAFMQSLIQTGILGSIAFMSALILVWALLFRLIKNLKDLPRSTKHAVGLAAGLLTFLTIRSITESTGAFFGVDWLILAPVMLHIEVLSRSTTSVDSVSLDSDN